MPLYAYECACGQVFEKRSESYDARHAACPSCGVLVSPKVSPVNWSFGWRPTEKALHVKGTNPYEYEKDV